MVDKAADKLLKSLQENWMVIVQDGEEEEKNVETMKDLADKVCKAEFEHYAYRDVLKNATRLDSFEAFEEALSEPLATQSGHSNSKHSKRYQDFVKYLNAVTARHTDADSSANMSNSEVFTMTETVNEIDPITKGPLEDPVRNKICKHIYGKESIIQAIRMGTRCPILGCPNKKQILMGDLEDDEEYARKLHHQRLTQEDPLEM